jgi:ribonuclease Y
MEIITLLVGVVALLSGAALGYHTRQKVAKRDYEAIETKVKKRMDDAREKSREMIRQAREKAEEVLEEARKEAEEKAEKLTEKEKFLLKRENNIDEKIANFEEREQNFEERVEKLRNVKKRIEELREEAEQELKRIGNLSEEEAKEEIIQKVEQEAETDLMKRIRKLEQNGRERYQRRAKEILATVIQKYGASQSQDLTTTNVSLPSDDIKGRIIGKEGRNIKTLEKLTGVEVVVDDTPETVLISSFDPIRRQIAKTALEKLIFDGRIQPARIEEMVDKAETEISEQIKKAGEQAVYDAGILELHPKIVKLLGRLYYRSSYGQNVLLHSREVSYLAEALADEIGADSFVCKKAGLLHDIGKALDHKVEGSHVDIGIRVLEKFGVKKEVIDAMKSHHEEYDFETIESVIVQTADAISGARPGARKDTLDDYLKRLKELEEVASNFPGIRKTYAVQAGREVRVFVKPDEISDLEARKLSKKIADRIEEELNYPGEIKVNVIREKRVIEYAK